MEDKIHKLLAQELAEAKREHKKWNEWSESTDTKTEGTFEEGWLKATEHLVKRIVHIIDENSSTEEKHYHVSFGFTTDLWAKNTDEAIDLATEEYDARGGAWEVTELG